jgi:hypothetical protein
VDNLAIEEEEYGLFRGAGRVCDKTTKQSVLLSDRSGNKNHRII